MSAARLLSLLFLVLALVAGGGLWLQREKAAVLRSELALLREDQRSLAKLQAEHERLRAAQVPEAELRRLRADREALLRLRTEIGQLQSRADQMTRNQQAGVSRAK